ncbi:MAG TPA: cation transporter [Dehalococcoidia bacterium]|nr:cation transporter [Dehalococcoidia bacterium]
MESERRMLQGFLAGERPALIRYSFGLLVFTLLYNIAEGFIAVGSGVAAGSIALMGFGLDSFIEVFAAGVLLQHFGKLTQGDGEDEGAGRRAEALIGLTFLLLAAYITAEAIFTLATGDQPQESFVGLGLAIASLLVMPVLGLSKRRCARRLCIPALEAESVETIVCAYLSFTLLLGLGLNALWGLWWADPAVALAMVPYVLKEGIEHVRGED